jgi:cytochrome o ubiquinol oxidase subunit II
VAILDPKGLVGAEEKSLILTAAGLMLIVIIPVIIMTVVFAWRYRASNTKATYSPEWAHSRPLEVIVWVVPFLIVTCLAYLAWTRSHSLDPFQPIDTGRSAVTVQVISLDWKWLFIYPGEDVAAVNEVAFPVNTPVAFLLTSDTVMNSFFIPRLGSQIYTMAGMQTQLHLVASHVGSYRGLSANFSGQGFSGMTFTARAMSRADYEDWLRAARGSARPLDQAAYAMLARPSEDNPVQYFSPVAPGLFAGVLDKYAAGGMKAKRMAARP